ncbi:MAG TPA: Tad domain-containing protein [Novosphingobium sp.]|nr:Tad domain-containing protein [Novosphingobium sp.]
MEHATDTATPITSDVLCRLLHDRAGNTLALVAAAILPILGMVGGGIDMGRSYLSQSRLQQACDSGVLAARKKLGSQIAATGEVPDDVAATGNKFFNLNFRDGSYGTESRDFEMTLENDYAISGVATVTVPTTIMKVFGFDEVPIQVECEARLNFSNTDVMMVLDTTGSMNQTNPGDSQPKIEVLRDVVKSFHAQLEGSKSAGTRIRYGFVPYSSNVNVGWLLKSGWMVDNWQYQGRKAVATGQVETYDTYAETYQDVSGSYAPITSYQATSCPTSTARWRTLSRSRDQLGNETGTVKVTGIYYWCDFSDSAGVTVNGTRYNDYVYRYTKTKTGTAVRDVYKWRYKEYPYDVRFLKGASDDSPLIGGSLTVPMAGWPSPSPTPIQAWFRGCIEERSTYEIDDYGNVDLSKALDLDIDTVPTPGDPDTQWRPMLHEISYERSIDWNGWGSFTKSQVTTYDDYLNAQGAGLSACPAAAQKLQEMDGSEVADYVDSLYAAGSTYHDIGMIWGGRLLSPTGIFADENADVGKSTSRNLIFLTDGETAPYDLTYGTYGIEPLDQRRWTPSSGQSLTQVVEGRFTVACSEVKKRNITVWVISFGLELNPLLSDCAGPGHAFEARDAASLNDAFSKIAGSIGDLRVSK